MSKNVLNNPSKNSYEQNIFHKAVCRACRQVTAPYISPPYRKASQIRCTVCEERRGDLGVELVDKAIQCNESLITRAKKHNSIDLETALSYFLKNNESESCGKEILNYG